MFLCKPCTNRSEGKGHFDQHIIGSFGLSRGACESCGKMSDCVDCKCYKAKKQKIKK